MVDSTISVNFSASLGDLVSGIAQARDALSSLGAPSKQLDAQYSQLRASLTHAFDATPITMYGTSLTGVSLLEHTLANERAQATEARRTGDEAASKEAAAVAEAAIHDDVRAVQEGLKDKMTALTEELRLRQITTSQEVSMARAALEQEHAAELAYLQGEEQIDAQSSVQKVRLLSQEIEADRQFHEQRAALTRQSLNEQYRDYEGFGSSISGAFNGQLKGLLSGTETWRAAFSRVLEEMLIEFIEWSEKLVVQYVAGEATKIAASTASEAATSAATIAGVESKTAATTAGVATKTAATTAGEAATTAATTAGVATKTAATTAGEAATTAATTAGVASKTAATTTGVATTTAVTIAGEATKTAATTAGVAARTGAEQTGAAASLATQGATMIRSILSSAAEAFAGVFGFLAPVLGPAAAGPAAGAYGAVAGMAGAVASADIGMWQVPQDMLTLVHHDELIMPSNEAGAFRQLLSNNGGESRGAVHITPTTHFHVSAIDSASVAQWMRSNSSSMVKAVDEAVRHGAALGAKRLRL